MKKSDILCPSIDRLGKISEPIRVRYSDNSWSILPRAI